ncbi:MAG: hypothetical protein HIU82_08475 [Proteobacteria bacterium]|nr:hypothetical protein [Pseudomonadota bacterium]
MAAVTTDLDASTIFTTLDGVPKVDIASNLRAAVTAGRRVTSILSDIIALQRGPGKLTPSEYFYYRLWNPELKSEDKRRFVGKRAQHRMHLACNDAHWYATAADKLLFHSVARGAGLPTPELLAVTHPSRRMRSARTLVGSEQIAAFLREPANYPLFAKPIDGKYSLSVVSADGYDAATDRVLLHGAEPVAPAELAQALTVRDAGYVLQRRLVPHPDLERLFGPRLWSVRVLVLMTPDGPRVHRALAKIATGQNPADNFWRVGNLLGAIDPVTGQIVRTVQGTGAEAAVNGAHPDSGHQIVGTSIPGWEDLMTLATEAASVLPGIRTQSWDIALAEQGPVLLEVNFGGDLNLAQLAEGAGVLDPAYREHLRSCGYRIS